MIRRSEIASVLKEPKIGETITVMGWVRAFRNNRFIALNDGSTAGNLQVVIEVDDLAKRVEALENAS